jgi:WD40 repeat protein
MIWDASNGKTVRVLKGHTDFVQKAVFSPDNKNVLTLGGNTDQTVRLWDVETGKQIYSVPSSGSGVALFFSPDGQTFYAGDNIYNTSDGRQIQSRGGILAISADGKFGVTNHGLDADLLDTNSLQLIRTFSGHIDSVESAAFSGDGKWLVTGSRDNTARVWDVASGKLVQILSGHTAGVKAVAFSPDGTKVLTGSTTGRLWSLDGGNQQKTISVPAGVSMAALSPDGTTILVGDLDGNPGLWDLNTGQSLLNFPEVNGFVHSLAFSPDGKMVAFQGRDSANNSVLKLFDPLNGTLLKTIPADSIQSDSGVLAFSSDSKMIFAWNYDNTARLWDIASGKVLRQINGKGPSNHSSPAAFSPDGKWVAFDGGKTWWDISAGHEIASPGGMNGDPNIFSDDGSLFADADVVKNVSVWKVSTKELIHSFSGHTDVVTSLAISSDNRLLLTGSADKTARLWDISTGQLLRVFSGHTAAVTSVAFTPDGKKIVTGSLDKTIRTWITDYNDFLAYACTRVGTDFTAQERVLYGISDQDPTCPQFGNQSQPLLPTTTLIPTRTPLPQWTPMPTATP